jgi:hypothetical protein
MELILIQKTPISLEYILSVNCLSEIVLFGDNFLLELTENEEELLLAEHVPENEKADMSGTRLSCFYIGFKQQNKLVRIKKDQHNCR